MTGAGGFAFLRSDDPRRRAGGLRAFSRHPSGDPGVLPILEDLLDDRTPSIVRFPIAYGEIRWMAAEALAAERFRQALTELIIAPQTVIPLSATKLFRLAAAAGVPYGDSWESLFTRMRDRGLLPTEDINWVPQSFGLPGSLES
jgi:hypothetical protein